MKKLKRLSIDELECSIDMINEEEQMEYVGGATGYRVDQGGNILGQAVGNFDSFGPGELLISTTSSDYSRLCPVGTLVSHANGGYGFTAAQARPFFEFMGSYTNVDWAMRIREEDPSNVTVKRSFYQVLSYSWIGPNYIDVIHSHPAGTGWQLTSDDLTASEVIPTGYNHTLSVYYMGQYRQVEIGKGRYIDTNTIY